MNCEKCQELLSDYLDGALSDEQHRLLSAHVEECLECFHVRSELDQIVSFCRETRGQYDAPPNERALWLRIRNTIEASASQPTSSTSATAATERARWWERLMDRHWELSLPQLAAAVSVIVIAVALGTSFSLKQTQGDGTGAPTTPLTAASRTQTSLQNTKAFTADVDDRVRRQQVSIDYLYERVSQRKARWNPQMRDAFERNLNVLDQAVEDSRQRLKSNPHDEISEEMLNAALNDKMELLKEFSEQ